MSDREERLPQYVQKFAVAAGGNGISEASLDTALDTGSQRPIGDIQLTALAASVKGDHDRAIDLMREAIKREEMMGAPSGPPNLIKPSHELFGEILLRANKPEAAGEQFQIALLRQPNRARSLLGAARAAAKATNDSEAARYYGKLLAQWQQADEELPELREARAFVAKVGTVPR